MLLESPDQARHHLYHMSASVAVNFAYGFGVQLRDDPLVKAIEENGVSFGRATRPGAYLVDSFPILKYVPEWFPGAGFKKFGRETRQRLQLIREIPFREVKADLRRGDARPSFVANSLLELANDDDANIDVDSVKHVASGVLGAATETTTSTLHSFLLAIAANPDILKRAQTEIDSVVGRGRLPGFSDRSSLPYITAIVKESLRWLPVFPTALPHANVAEDIYEGYRIPVGSTVVANVWSILHDPDLYHDPHMFRPERFLPDKQGHFKEKDPATAGSFGFGRRICAGKNLAESSLWLAVASLIAMFDITDAVSEYGRKIDPNYALDPAKSATGRPKPFSCRIRPRSKEIEEFIRSFELS